MSNKELLEDLMKDAKWETDKYAHNYAILEEQISYRAWERIIELEKKIEEVSK